MPDREKVIKGLEWILNDIEENGHYQVSYYADEIRKAIALLKEQEAVVRCKDCKHWVPGYITDTDDFIPPRCLDNHGVGWRAEDWCSFGVKWEDENAADRG